MYEKEESFDRHPIRVAILNKCIDPTLSGLVRRE